MSLGFNTTNFTSTNNLFLSYPFIEYWRFEVVYTFPSQSTSSALNFIINQPPQNGSCSITPLNGTTTTLFTISCSNWQDQDGIQDYSFYSMFHLFLLLLILSSTMKGWTSDFTQRTMIAFSSVDTVQVRLPAGTDHQSSVYIGGVIRDTLDCVTQVNLSSVTVVADSQQMTSLVDSLLNSSNDITTNPLVQILSSGNQNSIGQVTTSLSQEFNKINYQSITTAVASENIDESSHFLFNILSLDGILAATIAVSPLDSRSSQSVSDYFLFLLDIMILKQSWSSMNASALAEYNQQLNLYAGVRDYLITFSTNLLISTSDSIILQASSLVHLTQATNQLTRTTAVRTFNVINHHFSHANRCWHQTNVIS